MLSEQLEALVEDALLRLKSAPDSKSLYDVKVEFLGKNGKFTELLKGLGALPKEERPQAGKAINEKKKLLEGSYDELLQGLENSELSEKIKGDFFNFTMPGKKKSLGTLHPISLIIEEMVSVLGRLGFAVRTGPHIESDDLNFTRLNFPKDHPARDMQDTFYIDKEHVLRTHTSPIQIRTMLSEKPPLRIIAPGSVFRCDSDVSHSPNFNQVEGLYVDKEVSMAHLKGVIGFFVREIFGEKTKTRFRPSFFPFTEPSAEVDCTCPLCKGKGCRVCSQSGWIEIGGCGLVHPNVISACELDPDVWQGLAFGFGVERMAMIKYGVNDIRLFNENLIDFMEQFVQ